MQPSDITAALDTANIRHTKEAVAMLAECNAPAIDYKQYRSALFAAWPGAVNWTDELLRMSTEQLIAAHPGMPETKAMQAEIADLRAKLAEAQSHLPTSGFVDAPDVRNFGVGGFSVDEIMANYPNRRVIRRCASCGHETVVLP